MKKYSLVFLVLLLSVLGNALMIRTNSIGYAIRKAEFRDKENIKVLYQRVTAIPGGLARTSVEITDEYINELLSCGIMQGLMLVVEYEGILIGAITKYKLGPQNFDHVFSGGSIVIAPDFQGLGIGTDLISTFLTKVQFEHVDILRIELVVRESNPAISLYTRLGFVQEGRLKKRILAKDGNLEDDLLFVWFNPNFKK